MIDAATDAEVMLDLIVESVEAVVVVLAMVAIALTQAVVVVVAIA